MTNRICSQLVFTRETIQLTTPHSNWVLPCLVHSTIVYFVWHLRIIGYNMSATGTCPTSIQYKQVYVTQCSLCTVYMYMYPIHVAMCFVAESWVQNDNGVFTVLTTIYTCMWYNYCITLMSLPWSLYTILEDLLAWLTMPEIWLCCDKIHYNYQWLHAHWLCEHPPLVGGQRARFVWQAFVH